jgi:Zn-dependent peptidase ImmA (M78 family)
MYKIPYKTEEEIDDTVKDLLRNFKMETPPVDIEFMAEKLGLRIVPIFSRVRGFKGYLSVKSNEIGVNGRFFEDGCDNIYRFTVAHEMAHYALHKDFYSKFTGTSYDDWSEFYIKHSYVIDRAERQADIFAGLILLPTDMIEKDVGCFLKMFQQYDEDIKNEKIEYEISRKYQVSLKTAQIRLGQIKLRR